MGSDPFLARADHGARFLDLAASALSDDLADFLGPDSGSD
jgi:creatinine amidohydrolase